jgi:hypothetical protein
MKASSISSRNRNSGLFTESEWEPGIWLAAFLMFSMMGILIPAFAYIGIPLLSMLYFRDVIRDMILQISLVRSLLGGNWQLVEYHICPRFTGGNWRVISIWERSPGHTFRFDPSKGDYFEILRRNSDRSNRLFSAKECKLILFGALVMAILFLLPYFL